MHKVEVEMNNLIGENTYHSILSNGLNVYICKKEGFNKKIRRLVNLQNLLKNMII